MIPRVIYDVESRSEVDLKTRGLDIYANHPTTELLCATVATDNFIATASFVDSSDGRPALEAAMRAHGLNVIRPETLVATLHAAETVVASNVAFDQLVTARTLGVDIPKERWSCTMARAMRLSLPGSLEAGAKVLGLPEGKDKEGNRLSKQCWKPRPSWSKKVAERLPLGECGPKWFDDADRLARNAAYNAADVRVSLMLDKALPELEPAEREIWLHVWRMNERGIPLDMELVHGAIRISEEAQRDVIDRIRQYTGGMIQSLKAPAQLVAWAERYGVCFPSWTKDEVTAAIANPNLPEPVRVVAQARQEAARGSVAKFETAVGMVSADGRLRHQLLYAGTAPTQRLAGRGVQPLNLFRPKLMADQSSGLADIKAGRPVRIPEWKLRYDPEKALYAIRSGRIDLLREMGDPEEILSDNIRPMIKATPGKIIVSPDLSAIEARGVFWVSDCEKALNVYRRKGDLYCEFAGNVVGYPVNKHDHPEIRQNYGKVPILSCGYGAGASKVALTNKIDEQVALTGVQAYRREYHEVCSSWRELENCAVSAICSPGITFSACRGRVQFVFEAGWLRMCRPSGTWCYLPDAGVDSEGRLFYHAWIKGAWRTESIWGGVIINFVVQGFCRELMYAAEMKIAADPRYELFLQCYDSLSGLVDIERAEELCAYMIEVMETPPTWAPDMPLQAEGKPKERYA